MTQQASLAASPAGSKERILPVSDDEHSTQQAVPPASGPPASGVGGLAQSIGARNLWIIILAMPAVFLVVVAAIIAVFGKPGAADRGAKGAETEAPAIEDVAEQTPVELLPSTIEAPAGAVPGAIALDGDRLAVRLDGPDGVVVVVYDLAKGEVVARVPIRASDASSRGEE